MAMNDEVKEQRKKLKGKSFKEKLSYFWDYYKVHTLIALFVLLIVGIFVKDELTAKDYAFYSTLLNANAMDEQEGIQSDFAAFAGIDENVYDCSVDTSSTLSYETMSQIDLAVSQRIAAMSQTGGIDVLVSDQDPFTNFATAGMFPDLRETLTTEEYEKFKNQFFYVDKASMDINNNDTNYDEEGNLTVIDTSIDHSDPSKMEDPVPVGIYVTDAPKLKEWKCYTGTDDGIVFGFVYSSERPDVSHQFLAFLYETEKAAADTEQNDRASEKQDS